MSISLLTKGFIGAGDITIQRIQRLEFNVEIDFTRLEVEITAPRFEVDVEMDN